MDPSQTLDLPGLTPPAVRGKSPRRIGDVLVELGYATRDAVEAAVATSRECGVPTGRVLLQRGRITPTQLARVLAERFGFDHVDLASFAVDMRAVKLVPPDLARRHGAVPIAFLDDETLLVAMADPTNILALDDFSMMTGFEMRRAVGSLEDILGLVGRSNGDTASAAPADVVVKTEPSAQDTLDLRESADDAPVIKLVHSIIVDAVKRGASDIHFDPHHGDMKVRFRVDGVVSDATTVPRRLVKGLVSRIKVMADLDIAERRMPQDGRIALEVAGRHVDLRVVTLPIVAGESVVVKVVDRGSRLIDLGALGMGDADRARVEGALAASSGAVLVSGPTGSGKTTTLYAALETLNKPDRTLITIEDPVEYELESVKQVQVNGRSGLTFARGLRSMLRADPDVLMVGELRDRETAQTAIEASLTGHLVLAAVHTKDAPSALIRLLEMGIEPFLVASGLDCVICQRLVRTLCDCKRPVSIGVEMLRENGLPAVGPISAFEPQGCERCAGGYAGRTGIYEVMAISPRLHELVLERRSVDEIAALAEAEGMTRLAQDGLEKVRRGVTSVDELVRVLGS